MKSRLFPSFYPNNRIHATVFEKLNTDQLFEFMEEGFRDELKYLQEHSNLEYGDNNNYLNLNRDTTAIELLILSRWNEKYINDYENQKTFVPNVKNFIEFKIDEIKSMKNYTGEVLTNTGFELIICGKGDVSISMIEEEFGINFYLCDINNMYFVSGLEELLKGMAMAYLLPIAEHDLKKINEGNNQGIKFEWLGTPSQFGYIFQELIGKGYLKRPSTSYRKDAEFFLQSFNINTTLETLQKEISTGENQNSLSSINRSKIKIPLKDNLT